MAVSQKTCRTCSAPLARRNKTGFCRTCSYVQQSIERRANVSFEGGQATATKTVTTTEPVRTLDDLVRVCGIDLDAWQVVSWTANAWGAAAGDQTLYQVKAQLKANRPLLDAKAELAALKADAKRWAPRLPRIRRPKVTDPHLLELAIPDVHVGKLAWRPETGHASYDSKIAIRLYETAVETLLARVSHFQFDRILLPLGNDILNSDSKQGTTTAGTPLDNDSRYYKSFLAVRQMAVRVIERLRQIAPVDVVMVQSNHDHLSVWHLGDSLECYFHKTPDVTIANAPNPRKYYGYGNVALLLTHGDKGKATDWPLLFATEAPTLFGQAKYREVHTGHLHQTRVYEKHGVRVRISPALCSPDAWHADHQFVGQVRGAEAYVWSPNEGLVCVAHYNVDEAAEALMEDAAA